MRILLTESEIRQGVEGLARRIGRDYLDRTLTILSVLTGSVVFLADLIRRLDMALRVGVVQAASYRGATTEPGALRLNTDFLPDIRGQDVLLLDDILDSGHTLAKLRDELRRFEPRSLRTAVLLRKTGRQQAAITADYWVFDIPDLFVVGYGLDYDGHYRHLPYVAALEEGDLEST